MTPGEFRRWGHKVVDWIAEYQERVEGLPVLSKVKPGEIRASLPKEAPIHGESFETILADVDRLPTPCTLVHRPGGVSIECARPSVAL